MRKGPRTTKTLGVALLAGTALVALGCGNANAEVIETVVVTGSMISHAPGDQPTPTVVVDSNLIAKTGLPNIGAVLVQLPQIQTVGGGVDLTPTNSNFLTSGFGVSNVDLRALGSNRTLVLVNGRRQVAGSPTGSAVDLNTIPTQLIDRVEVITGGASSTYGSDAVTGVVNIILRSDFEGMMVTAQGGSSSRADGGDAYGAIMIGANFAGDRGNVTLSLTSDRSGAVHSEKRDLTATDETAVPGLGFPRYGTIGNLFASSAFSSFGVGGRFQIAVPNAVGNPLAFGTSFNPNGTVFSTKINGFDRNPHRYIQVPVARKVVAETAHYDITDWLTFFVDSTYAETHSSQQLEPYPGASTDGLSKPTSSGGTGILIPINNPFIPPALLSAIAAELGGVIPPTDPGLFFSRRFIDLGNRTGVVDRTLAKVTLGLKGTLWDDWTWNSYYEWGRTSEAQSNGGFYDKIKMQEALNSRAPLPGEVAPAGGGGFVCSDPVAQAAGCVPINLFGAGSITPEAAHYVASLVTLNDQQIEQVAQVTATGSLFDLWGAGAVKLAAGVEYRDEKADFVPDSATQAGTVAGNQQSAVHGSFNVQEIFGETLIPVLKNMPMAEYLEFNGGVRFAHYTTAGDATSWKYGLTYQPIDDLKFRAEEASATRAPNIAELFSPNAQTFPSISNDPCSHPTPGNVAANCAAQIAAIGPGFPGEPALPTYTGATGQAALQGVGGNTSGNPNLKPETAHTLTAGLVYTPSWLQGFTATVDYYDIRLTGAVGALSADQTLNACYQADPGLFATNIFCQQIIRQHDSVLGPIVRQINFPTFNLGSIKTSGIDTDLYYSFEMSDLDDSLAGAGSWSLTLNTTYLNSYTTDPGIIGTFPIFGAGTVGLPRWRSLFRATYDNGPLAVTTTIHYIGASDVDKTLDTPANRIPTYYYVDLHASYDVNKWAQVYVGANNLFDTRPPEIFPGSGLDTTGTGTIADVYDPIGLFLYGGVTLKTN